MARGHGAVVAEETLWVGPYRVLLTRKRIKRAYLRVDDAAGPVRVSAPARMARSDIEAFVLGRASWIEGRRRALAAAQPASPRRGHADADGSVLLWGELVPRESLASTDAGLVAALKRELAARAEPLVRAYEPVMGVEVRELRYRDMQTRWGTCNVVAHRIWLAVSLAHMPSECLELIVVHEMCHLHERGHGPRFKALMDRYLPDWRAREAVLKQAAKGR